MDLPHQVALHNIANAEVAATSQLTQITSQSHKSSNKGYEQITLLRVEFVHKILLRSVESMDKMHSVIWRPVTKQHLSSFDPDAQTIYLHDRRRTA